MLAIHIVGGVFVSLGVASGAWYIAENMQKLAFSRALLGCAINIASNFILIPYYGSIGAAIATVVSQIFATYIFDVMHIKTRRLFWMKTKSLIPFYIYR